MPNGVTKSQKTQHANNQRVKMEAKHTEQMDTLRKQFQSKVADLDDKNKTLTLQIAQATKKIPTTKEDTNQETLEMVGKLRLRLKEVRSKEREVANQLLAEVAKNQELVEQNAELTEGLYKGDYKTLDQYRTDLTTLKDVKNKNARLQDIVKDLNIQVLELSDQVENFGEGFQKKISADTLLIAKQARRIAELETEFLGDIVD